MLLLEVTSWDPEGPPNYGASQGSKVPLYDSLFIPPKSAERLG